MAYSVGGGMGSNSSAFFSQFVLSTITLEGFATRTTTIKTPPPPSPQSISSVFDPMKYFCFLFFFLKMNLIFRMHFTSVSCSLTAQL